MDLEKEITKLERYLLKHMRPEFIQELRDLDNDSRRDRLMKQAVAEQEIMDTRSKDDKLKAAKAEASSLNSIYNEQLRMNKKVARYLHLLIEDSGKV